MLQTTTKGFIRCLDSYGEILGTVLILIQKKFIHNTNKQI